MNAFPDTHQEQPFDKRAEEKPPTSPAAEGLRTYPDLSAYCLQDGLDLPYRLWLILRHHENGQGWATIEDVIRLSPGNKRQTKTWLRKGNGLFWNPDDHGRIWLMGLGAVCERLHVIPWRGTVNIPSEDIGNLKRFRAALYASFFAFKPKTISRGKLTEKFGRSAPTLREWEKTAGVKVQRNTAWARLPENRDYSKFPFSETDRKELKDKAADRKGGYYWVEHWPICPGDRKDRGKGKSVTFGVATEPVLCWFLPSTYSSSMYTKRATTLQRQARKRARSNTPVIEPGAKYSKLFFEPGDEEVNRTLQQTGAAFVDSRYNHHGMHMWSFCLAP